MSESSQADRINTLLDREEIRSLRLHYSALLDGGEAHRMGEVFTTDAEVKVTVGAMQGLPEIQRSLAEAYNSFDTLERQHYPFMHVVANHHITLTGPDTAEGSCYLLDLLTDRPASQHPFLLLGRYLDRYVRINGHWRIAHTELDVLWPHED